MSAFDSIQEAIEQIGLTKIIVVILVLALALGYFFFYPKNGSITLTVKALDGDALPGAEVTLTDANGNTLPTAYSDDAGVAAFKDVPPGDYSAAIDPGVGYGAATKSVSLASGGEAAETVSVERSTSVSVLPQENPSSLFLSYEKMSCEKKILFELRNAGANEEQVQLVADGGLKDAFVAPAPAVVPPGSSTFVEGSFTTSKGKVGDELKGKVRVKGTRSGADFDFVLEEAPKITVSPQKITGSVPLDPKDITVSNDGSKPVDIAQNSITIDGHYANSYSWTYFEPHIPAGESVTWWIALVAPENAAGKLVGTIRIPVPCGTLRVGIDTDVTE